MPRTHPIDFISMFAFIQRHNTFCDKTFELYIHIQQKKRRETREKKTQVILENAQRARYRCDRCDMDVNMCFVYINIFVCSHWKCKW